MGFEPTSLAAKDFKSFVYTIPPPAHENATRILISNNQITITKNGRIVCFVYWVLGIGYYSEAVFGGQDGIRTRVRGFADRSLTPRAPGQLSNLR